MADVLSEGLVVRMAPQPTLGTDPTAEWVQLRPDKGSLQGWEKTLQTIEQQQIDPYMVDRIGRVVGWAVSPQFSHDFTKDFADLFAEPMFRCAGAHPGGKGQRKYRPSAVVDGGAGEDSFTVAALGDLPNKTLIKSRGWVNAANNGIFTTMADSVAGSIKVLTGLLVAEAANPGNATVGVWGFEGASSDITLDASGNLNSTAEDFTLRGIPVGSLVQIGDGSAGTTYASLGILFAWVVSVAQRKVTLEGHFVLNGTALGADTGSGKTIRVRTSSFYGNYAITNGSYGKKRVEGEIEWANAGSDGTTRWAYMKGLAVNKVDIAAPLKQKVTATVAMVGIDATDDLAAAARLPAGAGAGAGPANAYSPLVTSMSDTANDIRFVRLLNGAANLVAKVNNWTLTLQNNVTPLEIQGLAGAKDHIYGTFQPMLKCEVYFDDSAQIAAANAGTPLSWDACVDNGDFMFAFRLPRVAMRQPKRNPQPNKQVMLNFDAPGFGHETTNLANVLCIFE